MGKRNTLEEFIMEAKAIHGDKYDYSKVKYINNKVKVCIICPEHGEFWQSPGKHLKGQGCPICAGTKKSNKEDFIAKAKLIHGDKYDYSKVKYINNKVKVCIICPEHGEFWQDPHNHLHGKGCPFCGKLISRPKKYTTEEFIKEAKIVHGNKYDYSKTKYIDISKKVCIICPEHGEFWQKPYSHISNHGCPICAHNSLGFLKRKTTETFIEQAKAIHGDKYDYSKVEYKTAKDKVCIICPKHGEFWQSPWHHIKGNGCPKCVHHISKNEQEIFEYIESIIGERNVIQSDHKTIKPKELDIYIPSLKFAIEYNGLYWHNEENGKGKNYHLSKTEACKEKGIKLIQIFEDEYTKRKDIVFSKLAHIMGKSVNLPKIMARKCTIAEIELEEARPFLEKNHIQGFGCGSIYLGAFYNNILIGVMAFKLEKNNKWELTRFASDNNYICCGIGGKLFNYFVKNYNPNEIKSFADRRWTVNEDNNVYTNLGFVFDKYLNPDYRYFKIEDGIERQHKFGFRKKTLNKKYGLPLSMTEDEMTKKLGYEKIYDCGLIKYVWKKSY